MTTISGNASNLLNNAEYFDQETKQQIYADIYNDSMWLTDLVENLLYATRIEDGCMMLQTSTELLSEMIEEAMQHIGRKAAARPIRVVQENEILLVKADPKLIVQVITNIVDNALKYTPADTAITLTAKRQTTWRRSGSQIQAEVFQMKKNGKFLINFTVAKIK